MPIVGVTDESCSGSPAHDRAESTRVVSSVRGQRAIRSMGKPKGVFLPAEHRGHRMQTGISLKAVSGSSTVRAKAFKVAPTKGRERRLVEELDKRSRIRHAKFVVERGTEDESSEESDSLPDYEESDATTKPLVSTQRDADASSGSDCERGRKRAADSGYESTVILSDYPGQPGLSVI